MAENPKPMAACESRDKERDLVAEIEREREHGKVNTGELGKSRTSGRIKRTLRMWRR
jgi:hypothetical protein